MDINESKKAEAYHRSRRMFCIYQGRLIIAEQNLPYSHADWFRINGWISNEDDRLMDEIVRGCVDRQKNIYFYKGLDFIVDEDAEQVFFSHLGELVEKLKLIQGSKIFGGAVKSEVGRKWMPRKEYGTVGDKL